MKNKNISAEQVWKDFEDRLAPQLNFSVNDRAVYPIFSGTAALKASFASAFRYPGSAPVFDSPPEPLASPFVA